MKEKNFGEEKIRSNIMYCPCPMRTSKKSTRTIFYPVWKKMTLSVAREFTTMHAGWKTGCYILLLYVSVRTYYKYNNMPRLGIYVYNMCYVLSVLIVENYKSCSPKTTRCIHVHTYNILGKCADVQSTLSACLTSYACFIQGNDVLHVYLMTSYFAHTATTYL